MLELPEFNISYDELLSAHNMTISKYDKAYEDLIIAIKNPWQSLDNILEFVRRWNSRVPIRKNKENIKEAVLNLKSKFDILEPICLEELNFSGGNVELIEEIYRSLSKTVLKFTGSSKLMHGVNPGLFTMWDKGICEHYGCYPNYIGYVRFMETSQQIIRNILKDHKKGEILKETNRTLPKLLDEYNWMHFRTSKAKT